MENDAPSRQRHNKKGRVMLTPFELGWLCGLIEGEGCCRAQKTHGVYYPFIAIRMTDEDIIERVAALIRKIIQTNARVIEYPDTRGWQRTYCFQVHGNHVRPLLELILPHMGDKKQGEIERALSNDQTDEEKISGSELLQRLGLDANNPNR
jgi:hypothetical protein